MKCQVCGANSGKYPLCRDCNTKKEQGLVIKCPLCRSWHYKDAPCPQLLQTNPNATYLYEARKALLSKSDQLFYEGLKQSVPAGFQVFPQINLATFVDRTDDARYRNELFRNIDFLITDENYAPKIAVEINDLSHMDKQRYERDEKVRHILEETGIPILTLWTSYGVNIAYITKTIQEILAAPVTRKQHFNSAPPEPIQPTGTTAPKIAPLPLAKKRGCYVATCVYGSYDCPQVWTLRRYRDEYLSQTWHGRLFIRLYYLVSPHLVSAFGNQALFHFVCSKMLDKKVAKLQHHGYDDSPYRDEN